MAEREPHKSHIRLEFFRHDEKSTEGNDAESDDRSVRLTKAGREHATTMGREKNPTPEVSVAFGSRRDRSIETSLRHVFAREDRITPQTSLEEIRRLIDAELKVGKKEVVTPQLDFNWSGSEAFQEAMKHHYREKKDALHFLVEESDDLVRKLKDTSSTSYTRQAANIAQLVERYVNVLPGWLGVVEEHPERYEKYNRELQRHFGSHQTVTESFLLKVIEKTEGQEAARKFIDSLPDQNGFGFSEGYTVLIQPGDGAPHIVLKFQDKEWVVTPEVLQEVIDDRNRLEEDIRRELKSDAGDRERT